MQLERADVSLLRGDACLNGMGLSVSRLGSLDSRLPVQTRAWRAKRANTRTITAMGFALGPWNLRYL